VRDVVANTFCIVEKGFVPTHERSFIALRLYLQIQNPLDSDMKNAWGSTKMPHASLHVKTNNTKSSAAANLLVDHRIWLGFGEDGG
jgi:hypothetical protein